MYRINVGNERSSPNARKRKNIPIASTINLEEVTASYVIMIKGPITNDVNQCFNGYTIFTSLSLSLLYPVVLWLTFGYAALLLSFKK